MSAGEELSKVVGRLGGAMAVTNGNAKYLHASKAQEILSLPYDKASNVTQISSNSGRVLNNFGAVASGFKILGTAGSIGNVIIDTYKAPANTRFEAFIGSTVSATYGTVGLGASVSVGATTLSWAGPYGAIAGGIIGGGVFLWEYEFNGGSDYVKSTYKNGLLKFNGKEYVQSR